MRKVEVAFLLLFRYASYIQRNSPPMNFIQNESIPKEDNWKSENEGSQKTARYFNDLFSTICIPLPLQSHSAGGINVSSTSSAVEFRTEAREVKARAELEGYRVIVDELGFSPVLVNYAVECKLRETGNEGFYI